MTIFILAYKDRFPICHESFSFFSFHKKSYLAVFLCFGGKTTLFIDNITIFNCKCKTIGQDHQDAKNQSLTLKLNKTKRNYAKIFEESNSNKKTNCAEEGMLLFEQIQRDMVHENEKEQHLTYIMEDAQFIESYIQPGKRKDWRDIYDKGKSNDFFKSYSSSNSLKSSYYNIQRRKKQKKILFLKKKKVVHFIFLCLLQLTRQAYSLSL